MSEGGRDGEGGRQGKGRGRKAKEWGRELIRRAEGGGRKGLNHYGKSSILVSECSVESKIMGWYQ